MTAAMGNRFASALAFGERLWERGANIENNLIKSMLFGGAGEIRAVDTI